MTMLVGTPLDNKYTITEVIGESGFANIYRAKHELQDKVFVIKEYCPKQLCRRLEDGRLCALVNDQYSQELFDQGLRKFASQARSSMRFEHPNLFHVREYFTSNNTGYSVMPDVKTFSLASFLKKNQSLNETQANALLQDVIDALKYVHAINDEMLMVNISPDTILLNVENGQAVLHCECRTLNTFSDCPPSISHYTAVELGMYGALDLVGCHSDIYSVAATFYHCLTGQRPLHASERLLKNEEVCLEKTLAAQFDQRLLKLIDLGLILRPEKRPRDVAQLLALSGFKNPTLFSS